MSFLQREFYRLQTALREQENANRYDLLYAAQQAIAWASDPDAYKSPSQMIMGTLEGLEDCLVSKNPAES
jgi:hypothetical protein